MPSSGIMGTSHSSFHSLAGPTPQTHVKSSIGKSLGALQADGFPGGLSATCDGPMLTCTDKQDRVQSANVKRET